MNEPEVLSFDWWSVFFRATLHFWMCWTLSRQAISKVESVESACVLPFHFFLQTQHGERCFWWRHTSKTASRGPGLWSETLLFTFYALHFPELLFTFQLVKDVWRCFRLYPCWSHWCDGFPLWAQFLICSFLSISICSWLMAPLQPATTHCRMVWKQREKSVKDQPD